MIPPPPQFIGTTLPNLNAIQPTVHKLSCPEDFLENGCLWLGAPQKYIGRIARSHRSSVENKCVKKLLFEKI